MSNLEGVLGQTQAELAAAHVRIAALEAELKQAAHPHLDERIIHYLSEYSWDVFALVNDRGSIEYVSPAVSRVMGYAVDEYIHLGLSDLTHPDDWQHAGSILQDLLASPGEHRTFEIRGKHKDGRWLWLELTAINHLHNSSLGAILVNARDITVQKTAQLELQSTAERYRAMSDLMSDYGFSYRVEADGAIVREWVTGSYTPITGYAVGEMPVEGIYGLYVPEDRARAQADVQETLTGKCVAAEYRILTKSGDLRWVHIIRRPVWSETENRVIRFYGGAQDITARKQIEEALRRSETRYRHMIEDQVDLICRYDRDLKVTFGNLAYCKTYGMSPETILGQSFFDKIPPEEHARARDHIASLTKDHPVAVSIHPSIQLDGTLRWFEWKDRAIFDAGGEIIEYQAIGRDVTEQKRAEDALRQSENYLRSLINSQTTFIVRVDMAGNVSYCNERYQQQFSWLPAPLIGRSAVELVVEEDWPKLVDTVFECLMNPGRVVQIEFRPITRHGEPMWTLWEFTAVADGDGLLHEIQCVGFDITRQKQAETELQAMNEVLEQRVAERTLELERTKNRIEAIVNYSGDAILLLDVVEGIQQANYAFESLFEVTEATYAGQHLTVFFEPEHAAMLESIMQQVVRSHQMTRVETQARRRDGSLFAVDISIAPVNHSAQEVTNLVCIIRDVTEQKQVEAALIESENRYRIISDMISDYAFANDVHPDGTLSTSWITEDSFYRLTKYYFSEIATTFELYHPEDVERAKRDVQLALQGNATSNEYRIITKTGDIRWVRVQRKLERNEHLDGTVRLYGAVEDITERKQAEEALRRSEERLRILFDNSPDAICLMRLDGTFVDVNPAGLRLIGLPRDQIVGYNVSALNLFQKPVYNTQVAEGLAVTEAGGSRTSEYEVIGKNGVVIIESVSHPITLENQTLQLAVIRDITSRREAEKALRESEENYRTLINTMSEGVVLQDKASFIRMANAAAQSILGLPSDQITGRGSSDPIWGAVHEDGSPFPGETHPAVVTLRTGEAQSNVVMGLRKTDGSVTWISINTRPVFKPGEKQADAVVATFADITQRLTAEKSLQKKLEQDQALQKYLQALHEIMIDLTQLNTLDDFYRQVVTLGLKRLGFDRMAVFLYDPERKMALGTYGTNMHGQLQSEQHLRFVINPAGVLHESLSRPNRFHYVEEIDLEDDRKVVGRGWNVAVPLRYGERNLGWIVADNLLNHQPASELQLEILGQYGIYVAASLARRQSEEALQKTKDQLQAILDYSTASIFMKDLDGRLMLFNRMTAADFGILNNEWVGQRESDLFPRAKADYFRQTDLKVIETREPISYEETFKGRTNWVTKFPIFDNRSQIYAIGGIATDMTERKHYEESLERALQKEKELGELKSRFVSIASHEFRTPLASILAAAETLSVYRDRMTPAQIDDRLGKIRLQVEHMKDIMEDVLHLSRIQAGRVEFKPTLGDLDALCRDIIDEFNMQAAYQERIRYTCNDAPIMQRFDNRLMRQIITNLISNALKYSFDKQPVYIQLSHDQTSLTFEVKDQGIGIPADDLDHLFEPFHRAKNVGTISGTGLGLSITKQAVEMHAGTIIPISEVNKGTTFTMRLPKSL